jgi:hypothetical protein
MKKKTFFILLSLWSSALIARIPSHHLIGVNRYLLHPWDSPYLGITALESGLISNIRFFLLEESKTVQTDDGRSIRIYKEDRPLSAHSQLVFQMFPSPAGDLAVDTNLVRYFRKDLGSFKNMAQFFLYLKTLRKDFPQDPAPTINQWASRIPGPQKRTKDFLGLIYRALEEELAPKHPGQFLLYSVEQIFWAYLCEIMNSHRDMEEFLEELIQQDGTHLMVQPGAGGVKLQDQPFSELPAQDRVERAYFASAAKKLGYQTPYGSGPLSNGDCRLIPTTEANKGYKFQNCVEETLRGFLNLFFYDSKSKSFDLHALDSLDPERSRLSEIKAFYAAQMPDRVEDGSKAMRTLFNGIVAGLNPLRRKQGRKDEIQYRRSSGQGENDNELEPGFLNSIRVLETIFDQTFLDESPNAYHCGDRAFQKVLDFLDTPSSKTHSVETTHNGFCCKFKGEQFSFSLSVSPNIHQGLVNFNQDERNLEGESLDVYDPTLQTTSLMTLLYLSHDQGGDFWKDWPIYGLFKTPLQSNEGIIQLVQTYVNDQIKAPTLVRIMEQALKAFAWNDEHSLYGLMSPLEALLPSLDQSDRSILSQVPAFRPQSMTSLDLLLLHKDILHPHLEISTGLLDGTIPPQLYQLPFHSLVILTNYGKGQSILIKEPLPVKRIRIFSRGYELKNLENLPLVEDLDTYFTEIDLKPGDLPRLQSISLEDDGDQNKKFLGLEHLSSLKELTLSRKGFEFNVEGMAQWALKLGNPDVSEKWKFGKSHINWSSYK